MHERVWGRRGPGGGIEGGPGPRTSLAHDGRRWSEGRGPPSTPGPGPAPGPALQSSSARAAAAAALWSQPRLVPAEGRGAAAPPGPLALSGRRPRGGACGAPASPLLRVLRSPSCHSERGAPRTWPSLSRVSGWKPKARWARSQAPQSPSGRRGHPESADGGALVQAGYRHRGCRGSLGPPLSAAPRSQLPHLPGGPPISFPAGEPP